MPAKPLRPEELSKAVRCAYDFDQQVVIDKRFRYIDRVCLNCSDRRAVKVNDVRRAARAGRLSGLCGRCAGRLNAIRIADEKRRGTYKGGRIVSSQGYVLILSPNHPRRNAQGSGYVLEHILVMEGQLGRHLLPNENVHHRNGRRDDNRSENLELWVKAQPAGQRVEDMVAFAKEMLVLYEPDALSQQQRIERVLV